MGTFLWSPLFCSLFPFVIFFSPLPPLRSPPPSLPYSLSLFCYLSVAILHFFSFVHSPSSSIAYPTFPSPSAFFSRLQRLCYYLFFLFPGFIFRLFYTSPSFISLSSPSHLLSAANITSNQTKKNSSKATLLSGIKSLSRKSPGNTRSSPHPHHHPDLSNINKRCLQQIHDPILCS
ncbi:MAG: hypothetical protein JOS17DRAFT_305423 [Linnemannia elongata]|nr:MAG: hypothetical protein JOS17DRAFT_305423 [Linnemannia elongata]